VKALSLDFRLVLGTTKSQLFAECSNDREGMSEAGVNVIRNVPDEQAELVLYYSVCDWQPMQLPQNRSDMVAEIYYVA